jgi:DNA protecting protein DprA
MDPSLISPGTAVHLLALRHAFGARRHHLADWLLEQPDPADRLATAPLAPGPESWQAGHAQLEALWATGIAMIPLWEAPEIFRRVRPAPVALFVRGNARLLGRPDALAIVGSRRASPGGSAWATALAERQARAGRLIVSGGARGIDAAAHRGALAAGAPTVAFVGTPGDRIYPASNRALFEAIVVGRGALVSEHPPLSATFKADHAMRNRFIAAIARSVVVVEAAAASGTLNTAKWALRLGTRLEISPPGVGVERAGLELLLEHGWADIRVD